MPQELVSDPHALIMTDEAQKRHESINFFLMTESVASAKARGNILIDRSLKFFSHVIPSTVMMLTTIKEKI